MALYSDENRKNKASGNGICIQKVRYRRVVAVDVTRKLGALAIIVCSRLTYAGKYREHSHGAPTRSISHPLAPMPCTRQLVNNVTATCVVLHPQPLHPWGLPT